MTSEETKLMLEAIVHIGTVLISIDKHLEELTTRSKPRQ